MLSPWVDGLTIGQVLDRTAQRLGDHEGVVFPQAGYRRSWRAFNAEVDQVARALVALGIEPGEHIAVWATNVPQWVMLQFAAARAGIVLVNINPAYRPFELEYVLEQSDAVTLFLVDRFKTSDYYAMLAEICPEIVLPKDGSLQRAKFPRLRNVVAIKGTQLPGMIAWDDFVAFADDTTDEQMHAIQSRLRPGDAINIQYTSGTTGFPKAAMLSHRNLLLNAYHGGRVSAA